MLDIKAVVRKWQDRELSDQQALTEIDQITMALNKREEGTPTSRVYLWKATI
jgi:hypothetical protein